MIGNYENSLEVVETPRLQAEERTALTSLADRQIERVLQAFQPDLSGTVPFLFQPNPAYQRAVAPVLSLGERRQLGVGGADWASVRALGQIAQKTVGAGPAPAC